MNVTLRPINLESIEDCLFLADGINDPNIQHLITVNLKEGPYEVVDPRLLLEGKRHHTSSRTYMIVVDKDVVGDVSIDSKFDYLMGDPEGTAWIGICINNPSYHGKGVGHIVMGMIESKCKEEGFKRIELGVFAYNIKAIKFYLAHGYKKFHTVEGFTYYDGSWHDDYRMEKRL